MTGPGARTGMFSMREMLSEEKGELDVPHLAEFTNCFLHHEGEQAKLIRQAEQCEAGAEIRPIQIQSGKTDEASSSLGHG